MKKTKVGIVGGGRFGMTLAQSLASNGVDVTLVDADWNVVQSLADSPIRALQGDATNPAVLRDADFGSCDIAVVAIGSALEASTLATINCKDLKIPRVVAKAGSALHGRVLSRVGADNVVYPDRDRAYRLAESILHRNPIDFFEIRSTGDEARPRETVVATGRETLQSDDRLVVFGPDKALDDLSD